MKVNIID